VQGWRNLPRFQARSSFGTWMHRIAVNAVLAQARRRSERLGRRESVEDELADTLADGEAGDTGAGLDVEAAIASLPRGARHVLVLSRVTAIRTRRRPRCSASRWVPARRSCTVRAKLLGQRLAAEEGS